MFPSRCEVLWVIQGKIKAAIVLKDFDALKKTRLALASVTQWLLKGHGLDSWSRAHTPGHV